MRFVEITVPAGKRDAVLGVLDDEEIDYVVTEETSDREFTAVVSFPLPSNAVEPVLDRLRDAGLPDDAYTVIIDAETVISRRYEALEQRYEQDEAADERISRDEVRARARDLAPGIETFVAMSVTSVLIATAGVLLDSAAVVVGSMVIAPLIGPAMATSVGTVLGDRDLFVRGTKLQVLGFVVAVVTATAFAAFLKVTHLVPLASGEVLSVGQVRERLAPDILSLVVALGSGAAGAYSLSSGVSTSLVGVAIAVALVPPVAVIGIGIAWGIPMLVLGSTVLVLVNFVSINLAALALLWYQGYRPEHWFREEQARTATIKRIGALLVAVLVLSSFLGAATYSSFRTATVEREVRADVQDVLAAERYGALSLIDITVETEGFVFARRPDRVIVTVGRPAGESYPRLADAIAAAVNDGRELAVEVRFVEIARSSP